MTAPGQLELFKQYLPDKPWCSDSEHDAWPRVLPKRAAVRRCGTGTFNRNAVGASVDGCSTWTVTASGAPLTRANLPAPTRSTDRTGTGTLPTASTRQCSWNGRRRAGFGRSGEVMKK